MTSLEQRAVQKLVTIEYAPVGNHQQLARKLYRLWVSDPLWSLSPLEQAELWFLIWHYRRQIEDVEIVAYADEVRNGALALRF